MWLIITAPSLPFPGWLEELLFMCGKQAASETHCCSFQSLGWEKQKFFGGVYSSQILLDTLKTYSLITSDHRELNAGIKCTGVHLSYTATLLNYICCCINVGLYFREILFIVEKFLSQYLEFLLYWARFHIMGLTVSLLTWSIHFIWGRRDRQQPRKLIRWFH